MSNTRHVNFDYGHTVMGTDGPNTEFEDTWQLFETEPKGIPDPRLANSTEITDPYEALEFMREAFSAVFDAVVPDSNGYINNGITVSREQAIVWHP